MRLERYYIAGTNKVCLDLKNIRDWESEIDFDTEQATIKFKYSPSEFAIVVYENGKKAEFDLIKIRENIRRFKGEEAPTKAKEQ
jgi:hypothetical protein